MSQTANDLRDAPYQGLINEDVMQRIIDITKIPLPLSQRIGTDSHTNMYCEWVVDELAAPSTSNAHVDGADSTGDDTAEGERQGNHSQISVKDVKVSTRARGVDTIGYGDALNYQVMQRSSELRRDVEATMLSNNASVKATNSVAGQSSGLGAWITTNAVDNASTAGGFNSGTGVVAGRTGGVKAGLTETDVRLVSKMIYQEGGEASVFMSTPSVTELWSSWMFDSSARVGVQSTETGQSATPSTAIGAVKVYVSDFSTLEIVPNRLQPNSTTNGANVYLLDPAYLRLSYLTGYRVEPLAKNGLADRRQMCVDWSFKVLNEKAQGIIADAADDTAVVT